MPVHKFVVAMGNVATASIHTLLSKVTTTLPWDDLPFILSQPRVFGRESEHIVAFQHLNAHLAEFQAFLRRISGAKIVHVVRNPRTHLLSLLNRAYLDRLAISSDPRAIKPDWRSYVDGVMLDALVNPIRFSDMMLASYEAVDFDELDDARAPKTLERICRALDIDPKGAFRSGDQFRFNSNFEYFVNRRGAALKLNTGFPFNVAFVTWSSVQLRGPYYRIASLAASDYFDDPSITGSTLQIFISFEDEYFSVVARDLILDAIKNYLMPVLPQLVEKMKAEFAQLNEVYENGVLRAVPADLEREVLAMKAADIEQYYGHLGGLRERWQL